MAKQSAKKAAKTDDELVKSYVKQKMNAFRKKYPWVTPVFFVAMAAIVALVIYSVWPRRSAQALCEIYKTDMVAMHDKISKVSEDMKTSDSITSLFGVLGVTAQTQGDLVLMFEKMDQVAPNEIEPDVKAIRDVLKKQADSAASANPLSLSSVLGTLASGLMSSLQAGGSFERFEKYTQQHCDLSFINTDTGSTTGAQQSAQDTTNLQTISLSDAAENSFKPWEGKQHGIVATYKGYLVIIDPATWKIIAKKKLPDTRGRTPGGDAGRSYELMRGYDSSSSSVYNANYRYIAGQFVRKQNEERTELALYDLASDSVVATGVSSKRTDQSLGFDPLNRNHLLYHKEYDLEYSSYDIGSKTESTYVNPYKTNEYQNGPLQLWNDGTTDKRHVFDATLSKVVDIRPDEAIEVQVKDQNSTGYPCEPILMVAGNQVVCVNSDINLLDVTNVLSNKTEHDDPSSYNYREGKLHYSLPALVKVDGGDSVHTRPMSIIATTDGKTLYYQSETDIYRYNTTEHRGTQAAVFPKGDTSSFAFLGWI